MEELAIAKNGLSYQAYRKLVEKLLSENKATGPNQSDELVAYSSLNQTRMNRLDKKTKIDPELQRQLQGIQRKQLWLVISEGWCGDAAQNLPVINQMTELSENIDLRIVLRDENLELMDKYLTNGGRSIPKLIVIDTQNEEVLGTWGPRPKTAQAMVVEFKNTNPNAPYSELSEQIHLWYARDRSQTIQGEFKDLLTQWVEKAFAV
jgi:hypothetical protein